MATGYSEWQSPRQADPGVSPSRRRVKELKQKFEAAGPDQSSGSHEAGKEHSHESGHGPVPSQGAGPYQESGPSQGSEPSGSLPTSQEFSDSLDFHETRPSFEDVLESTRIDDQPKKSRRPENVYPSRMEPEGFPDGFQYPNYARRPPKEETTEDSTPQSQDDYSYYKGWYFENIGKVTDFDILALAVVYLLQDSVPELHLDQYYPGNELADMLNDYVTDLQSKFRKFDIDLHEIEGHEIAGRIRNHNNKVLDVVSELEKRLEDSKEEISDLRSRLAESELELIKTHEIIEQFRVQQDEAAAKEFNLEELMRQFETRAQESQSKTQNEELKKLKSENEKLRETLKQFNFRRVTNEQQCMKDLMEAFDKHEIESMLKDALFDVLEQSHDKSLDKKILARVVEDWLEKLINEIKKNKELCNMTHAEYAKTKNKLIDLQNEHQELLEEMAIIQSKIAKIKKTVEHHKEQHQQLQSGINESTKQEAPMEESRNQLQSHVDSAGSNAGSPHSPKSSVAPHSSHGSGGTGGAEASRGAYSPEVSGGTQSIGPLDRQHSSVSRRSRSGSPREMPSPGKQTPMSGQTRRYRRLFRTESPDKRDSEERTPRYKHYFPSQGPDYGSEFSFYYPSAEYFGSHDMPEMRKQKPAKTPDPEAVIQPQLVPGHHIWFGPGTEPFTPPKEWYESLEDDVFYPGVGSPYDFRHMKERMKWKKGMIYKHILPSFGSDDDPFIHPYRFRDLPSDRYFLSPDAANGVQSSRGMQGTGASDKQGSSGNRSSSSGKHTPKGGQKRHDRRLIRTDRPDNRDSLEITPPYRHYFPSQGPDYGSDFSFQYPSPEYFENQRGGQEKCSHDHGQTLTKTITISPDKEEPFQVQIEMRPQGITESASGEHVVCDIAVNVQDVLKKALKMQEGFKRQKKTRKPPKQYMRGTPPITPSSQRDPNKGTPKSVFKQRHYGAKNLFGAKKDPYQYKRRRDNTIEWEQKTPEFENSFDKTLLDDDQSSPEDTSPNWNRPGGFDAPESQWNRPGEFGGASPPKEHSQSFPGAERQGGAHDPSTA